MAAPLLERTTLQVDEPYTSVGLVQSVFTSEGSGASATASLPAVCTGGHTVLVCIQLYSQTGGSSEIDLAASNPITDGVNTYTNIAAAEVKRTGTNWYQHIYFYQATGIIGGQKTITANFSAACYNYLTVWELTPSQYDQAVTNTGTATASAFTIGSITPPTNGAMLFEASNFDGDPGWSANSPWIFEENTGAGGGMTASAYTAQATSGAQTCTFIPSGTNGTMLWSGSGVSFVMPSSGTHYTENFAAALSFTSAQTKAIAKPNFAQHSLSFTGAMNKGIVRTAFAAGLSFTGQVTKSVIKSAFQAGLSFTGVLTSARTHIVNLIAGLSFTGQFTKNVQRLFTASLGFSGSFARQTTKNLTAGLSFSGRTIKNVVKTALTAGLSFAGSVASARTHIVNLAAGLSFAGGFFKQTTKDLTAGLSFTGAALTKNIGKSLTAGLSFTGRASKATAKTLNAGLMPGAVTYYDFENNTTSFIATNGTVAQVLGISHSGNASAQVTANGSGVIDFYHNVSNGNQWDSGSVVQGATYQFQAWVLAATTTENFRINVSWYDSGGLISGVQSSYSADSTSAWTQLSFQATAPPLATGVLVQLVSQSTPANGEIHYFDDISIVPINANLTKAITRSPLTAGLSFAGSVLKATVKSLVAAGLSFTGAFNSARTHLINLTAGLSFSGAFTKSVGKNLTAGVSFAGAQTKQIGHHLAAGLSFTGSITKAIVRAPFTAGLSFAGVMNSARTHLVNLFAGLSFTGNSLGKQIGKSLTAGLSFAGGFTKNVVKAPFKAGLSFTGSFTKQTTKMLTAGLSFAGKLSKGTVHNLAAGLSFTGGLTKHIIRAAMTAGLSFSGSVAKAVDHTISAGLTFAGSLKRSTVYVILFTAGVSFAGLVSRAISRTLTASVAFAGGFLKQIVKRLTAAAVGFSGAVSATHSTIHNYVITFAAGMGFTGAIHGVTGTLKRAWRGAVGRIVKEPQGPAPEPPEPTTVTRGGSGRVVDQPQQPDTESPSESSTTKTRGAGPR